MSFDQAPLTKLTTIYEKKSKSSGNRYFVGRLGASKILIFYDEKASQENGDPVWNVLLQEADTKKANGKSRSSAANTEQKRDRASAAQAPIADDPIPF